MKGKKSSSHLIFGLLTSLLVLICIFRSESQAQQVNTWQSQSAWTTIANTSVWLQV